MIWPLVIVPVLWLFTWVWSAHHDKIDERKEKVDWLASELSLPVVSVPPIHNDKVFNMLCVAIARTRPGHDIVFLQGPDLPKERWELLPFSYHDYRIWIKRAA